MNGRERVDEFAALIHIARMGDAETMAGDWAQVSRAGDAIARDLDAPIRWRPIESAPKDGTEILLAPAPYRSGACIGFFSVHSGGFFDKGGWNRLNPTHFAELKGPDHG